MNIYVASSWRNEFQDIIVQTLRAIGHEVYDFKNPEPGNNGFKWSEINPEWQRWTMAEYRDALQHPVAQAGYSRDYAAMQKADAAVLVNPCGRSAHLEAGWFSGAGKPFLVYIPVQADISIEPDLMYLLSPHDRPIVLTQYEMMNELRRIERRDPTNKLSDRESPFGL